MRQVGAAIWILLHLLLEKSASQDLAPAVGRVTRSEYAACASAGRMPNNDAEACETYYLCAVNTDGTLTVALAYCPLSTVFSPEKLQCVSASTYACPNVLPIVAPAAVTSLPADESDPFECTEVGPFPDPASVDCKTYFLCSRDQNQNMEQYLIQCPGETVFDAAQGSCVASAPGVCPSAPTPPPEETTPTTTVAQFVCPDVGRFPNEQSMDCKLYYLCSRDQNREMQLYLAQCPGETVFDAAQGACVAPAPGVCPSAPTPPPGETTTTVAQFVCPSVGRFPNEQSMDCKAYYLCSRDQNGNMVLNAAQCPLSTVFNPAELKCVPPESYTCLRTTTEPTVTDTPAPTTVDPPTTEVATPSETPTTTDVDSSSTTGSVTDITDEETMEPIVTDTPTPSETPTTTDVDSSSTTGSVTDITDEETMEPIVTDTPTPSETPTTTVDPPTTEVATPSETPTTTDVDSSSTTGSVTDITDEETMEPIVTDTPTPSETTTTTDVDSSSTTGSVTDITDEETMEPIVTDTPTPSETTTTTDVDSSSTTGSVTDITDEETIEPIVTNPPTPSETTTTTDVDSSSTTGGVTDITDEETMEPIVTETSTPTTVDPPTTDGTTEVMTNTDAPTDSSTSVESTTDSVDGPSTALAPFVCPDLGRYADPDASACETYLLCMENSIGTLTAVPLPCPQSTIFSEALGQCVAASKFSCGRDRTTEPDVDVTSTTATMTPATSQPTTPTPEPFVCPSDGRHANPGSIYCKSYYLCLRDMSNRLYPIELSCPMDSIFHQAELRCVPADEYTCIPTEPTATTTTTTLPTTPKPFVCPSDGRHAKPGAINSPSYYLCLRDTSNRLYPLELSCPMNSIFLEAELRCVPDTVHTRMLQETTVTTTTTTTTTSAPATADQPVCVAQGKLPATNQLPSCQWYTYCIRASTGDFVQYSFRCPLGTLFDEEQRLCSASYVCPR